MCRLPMMRAPVSGLAAPYCCRSAINPGISCSARRISLRPNSARVRSLTLYGSRPAALAAAKGCRCSVAVGIVILQKAQGGRRNSCNQYILPAEALPELPDVIIYIEALEARLVGQVLQSVRLFSPFVLRSVDPPISAIEGLS